MAKIGIDIDDTLCSFTDQARSLLANWPDAIYADRARQAAYSPWTQWRMAADLCDGFWQDVIDKCHEPDMIMANQPYPGAVEVIQALHKRGHHLFYISNRHPSRHEPTAAWLEKNGFPMDTLLCTYDAKLPWIADCQYLIDDRPKTLVEFVYDYNWKNYHGSENQSKARRGFGIMTPANQSFTDVPKVYLAPNWKLLRRYLALKGGLVDYE